MHEPLHGLEHTLRLIYLVRLEKGFHQFDILGKVYGYSEGVNSQQPVITMHHLISDASEMMNIPNDDAINALLTGYLALDSALK